MWCSGSLLLYTCPHLPTMLSVVGIFEPTQVPQSLFDNSSIQYPKIGTQISDVEPGPKCLRRSPTYICVCVAEATRIEDSNGNSGRTGWGYGHRKRLGAVVIVVMDPNAAFVGAD